MKKIIMIASIAAFISTETAVYAGTTAKKIGASAKIVWGVLGLPASIFLAYKGLTLQVVKTKRISSGDRTSYVEASPKVAHRLHNFLGAISILPLSIIAIESGINDLKNIKNEGITV